MTKTIKMGERKLKGKKINEKRVEKQKIKEPIILIEIITRRTNSTNRSRNKMRKENKSQLTGDHNPN
jgi:hypothetical protein